MIRFLSIVAFGVVLSIGTSGGFAAISAENNQKKATEIEQQLKELNLELENATNRFEYWACLCDEFSVEGAMESVVENAHSKLEILLGNSSYTSKEILEDFHTLSQISFQVFGKKVQIPIRISLWSNRLNAQWDMHVIEYKIQQIEREYEEVTKEWEKGGGGVSAGGGAQDDF